MDKGTSFLIVGAGTFGLSTAWHLAKQGYTNVKVIDRWAPPSLASAGYDISKVMRTEYLNPMYTALAHESLLAWETLEPLASSGAYHPTGFVSLPATPQLYARIAKYVENTRTYRLAHPEEFDAEKEIESLDDRQAILKRAPQLDGEMEGWKGWCIARGGWLEAGRAMEVIAAECREIGVVFVDGKRGAMREVKYDLEGKLEGVEAEDGTLHTADKIVLAMGAWSESLFDFEGQLISGTYARVHLQLTDEELAKYAGLPVVHIPGRGYFFPPTPTGVFKTCASLPAQTFLVDGWRGRPGKTSVPRDPGLHPEDVQPVENQAESLHVLEGCLPHLAKKEVEWSKLCYDTESVDNHFIISPHPSSPKQLYLATAGSGHAFKNFPILGKYVIQMLEGTLSDEHREAWRWRPDIVGTDRDTEKDVRHVDLSELSGWMKGEPGVP